MLSLLATWLPRVDVFGISTGSAPVTVHVMDGQDQAARTAECISHALPVPSSLRPPDPPLELAEVVLRPPEAADLAHLREASLHPDIEQTLWLPLPYRASEKLRQDRLQEYLTGWEGRGAFGATLFAFARKTGELVAALGIRARRENGAELIYGVAPRVAEPRPRDQAGSLGLGVAVRPGRRPRRTLDRSRQSCLEAGRREGRLQADTGRAEGRPQDWRAVRGRALRVQTLDAVRRSFPRARQGCSCSATPAARASRGQPAITKEQL